MRVFIGIDCDERRLVMGFVGSQGILKALSTTASPLPGHPDMLGARLIGMIRGLRGELNIRMKSFCGMGIGVPGPYVAEVRARIEESMKRFADMPVHVEDRHAAAERGAAWLREVERAIGPVGRQPDVDLSVIYGAAKLAMPG